MTELLIVTLASALVFAVCVLFVLHKQYHAGLFGNIGLCLIAIVAASRLASTLELGPEIRISPQGVLLWIGLALFFGRQALRFLWRMRCAADWYQGRNMRRRCEAPAAGAVMERVS
jgi:hypothetical protein